MHYPRIIEQFGPIIRFWCMRFEKKHQQYKKIMHMSCNVKNVPKSIVRRHQIYFAVKVMNWKHTVG